MLLPHGGMDIHYLDESTDRDLLVIVTVAVPFIRQSDSAWTVAWPDHFQALRAWRRDLSKSFDIPVSKELKGSKLAAGRGRYRRGNRQLSRAEAAEAYRWALSALTFLQPESITTAVGTPASNLYGNTRLEAVLHALLQRMQATAGRQGRLGMVFFDQGHGEYRKLYRKAQIHLPTGSDRGDWGGGSGTKNVPMANFIKDGNEKDSRHSYYTQLADLVSYAALLALRAETGSLTPWQKDLGLGDLYDYIPKQVINLSATRFDSRGIVRVR